MLADKFVVDYKLKWIVTFIAYRKKLLSKDISKEKG